MTTEPDHPEPDAVLHPAAGGKRPLSIINLMRRRWQVSLLSLVLVTVETVGYQVGPFLTKIGIDSGINSGISPTISVVVICGVVYIGSVFATMVVERNSDPCEPAGSRRRS